MALSAGQVTDTFRSTLGRDPTASELSKYSAMGNLEGSPGQSSLASMLGGGGGQSSGGGSGVATPTSGTTIDYGSAYAAASSQIPQVDTTPLSQAASAILTSSENQAKSIEASIPTVQNIYTDLAKQLLSQFQTDKSTQEQTKTKQIASETTAAAASGIDTTTGYEAALTRGIAADQDKIIQSISDKYGVASDKLIQEESKSVSDLVVEAQKARADGNTQYADLTTKIITLKQNQESLVAQAANDILNASSKEEKLAYQNQYQSALLDFKQQTLNLEATRLGYQYPGGQKKPTTTEIKTQAASDAAQGATLQQVFDYYVNGNNDQGVQISAQEAYDIYNNNSKYGHAKETMQQALQGSFANAPKKK